MSHAVLSAISSFCFAALAGTQFAPAFAESPEMPIYVDESRLTPKAVAYIADIAKPATVNFREGDDIAAIAEKVCGRKDKLYLDYILTRLPEAIVQALPRGDISEASKVSKDGTAELPFCLKLPLKTAEGLAVVSSPTIRRGSLGFDAKTLNDLLASNGFNVSTTTKFDRTTEDALKTFQSKAGLKVDGIAGADTWKELAAATPADVYLKTQSGRFVRDVTTTEIKFQEPACMPYGWQDAAVCPAALGPQINYWATGIDANEGGGVPAGIRVAPAPVPAGYGGLSSIPTRSDLSPDQSATAHVEVAALMNGAASTDRIADQKLRLISELAEIDAAECMASEPDFNRYPLKIAEFVEFLGATAEYAEAMDARHYPKTILVADSGIFGRGIAPLRRNLFRNQLSAGDPEAAWKPIEGFGKKMHGTYVTSAALGTSQLRSLGALYDFNLQVLPRNIVDAQSLGLTMEKIGDAVATGPDVAKIVNLSFIGPQAESSIRQAIDNSAQLFVVAAGNDKRELGATDAREYPAEFGGRGQQNVITVGAITQNGTYAKFANWGTDHIEIAAPGCKIPVYEYRNGFFVEYKHGTSLAAPMVSFAAAMIIQYTDWKAKKIKDRLIASADVVDAYTLSDAKERVLAQKHANEAAANAAAQTLVAALKELPAKVEHGRTLNIPKALAVFHDVLTTSQKDAPPMLGKFIGPDVIRLCDRNIDRRKLRKIVPRFINKEGEEHLLVYYTLHNEQMERRDCALDSSAAETMIQFEKRGGVAITLPLNNVRDLVFAPPS